MIRCALLSRWHVHANDYARDAKANAHLEIAAVWDESPQRGSAWAIELGVPFYEDLDALLASDSIDAVIIATPTNMHKDVMMRAARQGKHIFTEKVLGLTVAECEDVFQAVDAAGIHFMISLPRLTDPTYLYAQEVIGRGELGDLQSVRCRLAHNGALPYEDHPHGWLPAHFFDPITCGGGALIDLGAHPIYLTNRLAGPATAVTARFRYGLGHAVEDQAVVIVEYANGALGILEAGFTSGSSPFLLEIHGTQGSILVEDGSLRLKSPMTEQKWHPVVLPPAIARPIEQWANAIQSGTTPTITRQDALWLTRINEAAAASHASGTRITLG